MPKHETIDAQDKISATDVVTTESVVWNSDDSNELIFWKDEISIQEQVNGFEKRLKGFDNKLKGTQNILIDLNDTLRDKITEVERKLTSDKTSLLTIFWIFASIVTFLSIEVQFIKEVCDFNRLLWISLFILGWFLSFVVALQYLTKSWIENESTFNFSLSDFNFWTKTFWTTLVEHKFKLPYSIIFVIVIIWTIFYYWSIYMSQASSEVLCRNQEVKELKEDLDIFQKELTNMVENNKNATNSSISEMQNIQKTMLQKQEVLEQKTLLLNSKDK